MRVPNRKPLRLTLDEARGIMLAAQGLWRIPAESATGNARKNEIPAESATASIADSEIPAESATGTASEYQISAESATVFPPRLAGERPGVRLSKNEIPAESATLASVRAEIERLGVVQVDTISVVARSQYLVLWSRLGPYDPTLLDALHSPHRGIFEYWSHAASIVPMSDYPYYRADMLRAAEVHLWDPLRDWMRENAAVIEETRAAIRTRGPLASADFERDPSAARANPWDWYGPKESRKALDVLWTLGELMISSRRGGQKVYDLRERVLKEALGKVPRDSRLPSPPEQRDHFTRRTIQALGILTPAWLWDYFRLHDYVITAGSNGHKPTKRAAAEATLAALASKKKLLPVEIDGLQGPAYLDPSRLADLEWLRAGERPARTTLLSPFDNLIWHRQRARDLFGYEVCFEAYVLPEKRRYGYYCLAILHQGRLVGRLDPKFVRAERGLLVRSVHLEPGEPVDGALLVGLAGTLRELAAFLGAETIVVERSDPPELTPMLAEHLALDPPSERFN